MKLLRILPTGFFAYGQHDWVSLDNQGVVHLRGDIGSGKSSLFSALTEILYGMSPQRENTREVGEGDVVNATLGMAFGVVEFEARNQKYRVIYVRDWTATAPVSEPSEQQDIAGGYSGTSVYFERWDGSQWVQKDVDGSDLRYPKMDDTRKRVAEVCGCDYAGFMSTCFVAQDRALAFIKGKNADREAIITNIKGLGIYDEWEKRAKLKQKDAAAEVARLEAIVQTLNTQAAAVVVPNRDELTAALVKASEYVGVLEAAITECNGHISTAKAVATAEQNEALRIRDALDTVLRKIYAGTDASRQIRSQIDGERQRAALAVSKLPKESPLLVEAGQKLLSAKATLGSEEKRLASMLPGTTGGKCSSCGSTIDEATLALHKAEQQKEIEKAKEVLWCRQEKWNELKLEVDSALKKMQADIEMARDQKIAELEIQSTAYMAEVLSLEATKTVLQTQLAEANTKSMADTAALEAQLKDLTKQKTAWTAEQSKLSNALQIADQRAADKARIEGEALVTSGTMEAAKIDAGEWAWLSKNYPKIKQLKFSSILQDLNERLAYYLTILTNGNTTVTLEPYRLKKGAEKKAPDKRSPDDYIYEFIMNVSEPGKLDVPIQLYSGGERAQITLALISAFWELAAQQGGVENLLLLDEVISFLDGAAIERVVRLVEDLRSRVSTLIIIGHDPTFPSLLSADLTLTASKKGGMTTLIPS